MTSKATQVLGILLGVMSGFVGGLMAAFIAQTSYAVAVPTGGRASVLETNELRILDESGRARAVLGFRSKTEPEFRLMGEDGHTRVSIGVRANGYGGVWLYDKRGDLPTVSLHGMTQGPSSLMFYDEKGRPHAELGNELGFDELGFKPDDPSTPISLKFWKGSAFTGALFWHAP